MRTHQPHQPLGRARRWRAVQIGLDGKRHGMAWGRRSDAEQHAAFMTAEVKANAALWRELADAKNWYHDGSR
jgi:hypothetical protein